MSSWDAEGREYKPLLTNSENREYQSRHVGVTEEGRKCNDLVFAILFLLTCGAMGAISVVAFSQGDPALLKPSYHPQWADHIKDHSEFWFQNHVAETKRDLPILGAAVGIALVLGMIWVQLMRMFTKVFIYGTLILGILLVAACGTFSTVYGFQHGHTYWTAIGVAILVLAIILVFVMLYLRKRIALTSALFAECCHGVEHNPGLFLVALIMVALFAAFMLYWIATFIYLFSIRDKTVQLQPNLPPKFDQKVRNLMYFQVFGFYWTSALISGLFQMSVAGAIATWYFSRSATYQPKHKSPAFTSLARAFTLSFGSVAFGALIYAIVRFISFLLEQAKKSSKQNKIVVYLVCCIQCFLGCIEGIVKFVNRFAFIYIALHGDNFCTAAKGCFELISKNMFTAVIVDLLGQFVLFVGKLMGTAICTLFTVGIVLAFGRPLSFVTVALVVVIAYCIFNLYAHIVGVGVDTIFVCYMEDLQNHKEGSLFMEPKLHEMLQQRAKESTYDDKQ